MVTQYVLYYTIGAYWIQVSTGYLISPDSFLGFWIHGGSRKEGNFLHVHFHPIERIGKILMACVQSVLT